MRKTKLQATVLAAALAGAMSATAALTVGFTGVSPVQVVNLDVTGSSTFSGGVYAGIYNLTVNGVATPSFCIDVNRDAPPSAGYADYSYAPLTGAPLSPVGPMSGAQATAIEQLWAAYYKPSTLDSSGVTAAALQVAIWQELGNGQLLVNGKPGYTVIAGGNDPVTGLATTMLGNLPNLTTEANLVALVSPSGQNYVVPVPEPTTVVAGFGALSFVLLGLRRRSGVVRIGK